MKSYDEIIFSTDFENFVHNEPNFNVLLDLKYFIQTELKALGNNKLIPHELSESEKIEFKYGKATHDRILVLNNSLKILSERIAYISHLNRADIKTFIVTLTEEKLSKISANDLIAIANKLDKDSFFNLLEQIQMLKVPYYFKKNCPDFFDRDLSILNEIRNNKFPVSAEVKSILASGKFDSPSEISNPSSNSLENR